jgi:hypothetical protein
MSEQSELSESSGGYPESLTQNHSSFILNPYKSVMENYLNLNTLVIGKRTTGKTVLVIYELYRQIQSEITEVYVISNIYETEYKKITNKIYSPNDLPEIVSHIMKNYAKNTLIIIDGEMDMDWNKSNEFKTIMLNGRHFHISLFFTSQIDYGLTPTIRGNIDNVIVAQDSVESNTKRLYEHYFGLFPKFTLFKEALSFLPCHTFLINNLRQSEHNLGWIKANVCGPLELRYIPNDFEPKKKNQNIDLSLVIERLNHSIDEMVSIRNLLKEFESNRQNNQNA